MIFKFEDKPLCSINLKLEDEAVPVSFHCILVALGAAVKQ